jgi:hypothetical protein
MLAIYGDIEEEARRGISAAQQQKKFSHRKNAAQPNLQTPADPSARCGRRVARQQHDVLQRGAGFGFLWHCAWECSIAFAFLFFTVLAKIGTGEHYFVDLVAAFPFALMMESLREFSQPLLDRRRLTAVGVGLFGTLVWLLALRYAPHLFWISTVLPRTLCVATIAISLVCESQLQSKDKINGARTTPAPPQTTC